jgi:hypothetical protein
VLEFEVFDDVGGVSYFTALLALERNVCLGLDLHV